MSDLQISIHPESSNNFSEIDILLKEAFGGIQEVELVDNIRKSNEYIPNLSLVAIHSEQVIGHLMFSKIVLHSKSGVDHSILSLAPLSVLPKYQKQGVGSALMRQGLRKAKKLTYPLIVVIGHEHYYPKFGFMSAKPHGLTVKYKIPDNAFFVMELEDRFLMDQQGLVEFPLYFDQAM